MSLPQESQLRSPLSPIRHHRRRPPGSWVLQPRRHALQAVGGPAWSRCRAARVRFRERVQVGRCGEREGFWSGSLRADADDGPLLRHRVELGAGSPVDDVIASPRAAIHELRYPEMAFADTAVAAGSTVLKLAGGGLLSTWQADRLAG